jgi:hypothetical protein
MENYITDGLSVMHGATRQGDGNQPARFLAGCNDFAENEGLYRVACER